ncbi:MAG TPA: hypothetical protein VFV30_02445, partial [Novosphingobium sp.]|nr:hypothetical protein [Novosphingobium sp.]
AIDLRDDDRFPVSMMGEKWANLVCGDADDSPIPITEKTRQGCARRKVERDRMEEEIELSFKLEGDPALRDRLCRRTPAGQRTEVQNAACQSAESQLAWRKERADRDREAARLLANPTALDKQCAGVKIGRNDIAATALGEACQKRAEVLRDRETERLVKVMERDPGEYTRLCHWDYPQITSEDPVEVACERIQSDKEDAARQRDYAELDKLSPAQLEAQCQALAAEEDRKRAAAKPGEPIESNYTAFSAACDSLASTRREARWKALQADPAKLAEACAKATEETDHDLADRCADQKAWEEEERLDRQAWALAKDHAALVSACQSTPHDARGPVLAMACERYRKCLILPVGTRIPEKNMIRADWVRMGSEEESARLFYEGRFGDGHGAFCYETVEEANTAWELVKDPAKRVIDQTATYNGYPVPRPKPAKRN